MKRSFLYTSLTAVLVISTLFGTSRATTDAPDEQEVVTQSNWQKIKSGIKGLWNDFYTEHFVKKYQRLEDLYSKTKNDLKRKVDDTEEYVSAVTKRQRELLKAVGNETKESAKKVLARLNAWTDDLSNFKHEIANSVEEKYYNLTEHWRESIGTKWNNGLEKIVEITKNAEISPSESRNKPILIEQLEGKETISANATSTNTITKQTTQGSTRTTKVTTGAAVNATKAPASKSTTLKASGGKHNN